MLLGPGESASIWVEFFDDESSFRQHLDVIDFPPQSDGDEDVQVNLGGSGTAEVTVDVILSSYPG